MNQAHKMYIDNSVKSFHSVKIFLLSVIILLLPYIINAQATQQWAARYNMSADTTFIPKEIKIDAAGNIYVAGYKQFNSPNTADQVILKYSSSGTLLWVRTFNGPGNGNDLIYAMTLDISGNIYVTGESNGAGGPTNSADCTTLKYNPSGILLWQARYNSVYGDYGNSIAVDSLNNVYVAAVLLDSNGNTNLLTLKYNSSGTQLWSDTYSYSDSSRENFPKIVLSNNNNIYIVSECRNGTNNRWHNFLTLKYSPAGNRLWTAVYNGPSDSSDLPRCISTDAFGDVYISGYSRGINTRDDAALVKYNSAGIEQWVRRYNHSGNSNDGCSSIAIDAGFVYLSGGTSSIGSQSDGLILKYSLNGTLQWAVSYAGPGNDDDGFHDILVDNSGYIYAGGYTKSIATQEDYLTIKYTPSGAIQWLKTYEGGINSEESIECIALDAQQNLYVTGSSYNGNEYDIATIKYSQTVGVTPESSEIPSSYSLSQNYPNPFNPVTTINFSIPEGGHVKLTVYDMLGDEVSFLVNEILSAGSYNIDFDASNLPSGVYFCKLTAGSYSDVKKMVLAK